MKKEKATPFVYRELAKQISYLESNIRSGNLSGAKKYEEAVTRIVKAYFPMGGGITGCSIDLTQHKTLLINGCIRVEDGNCFKHKMIEFTVKVSPCLKYGTNINIVGSFGKKNESTKDYLYQLFDSTLHEVVEKRNVQDSKKKTVPKKESLWNWGK